MLIAGNREVAEGTISVRLRSGDELGSLSLDALIARMSAEARPEPAASQESWDSRCC
jgi:threonyl-tRNA synthetase